MNSLLPWFNYLSKAPPLNNIMEGMRIRYWNLVGEGTQTFSSQVTGEESFQPTVLDLLEKRGQKNEVGPNTRKTLNSRQSKHPHIRAKTIKFLRKKKKNTGQKLHYIEFGHDFLYMTPRAQNNRLKSTRLWLHWSLKLLFIKRVKRQPMDWGEKMHTICLIRNECPK